MSSARSPRRCLGALALVLTLVLNGTLPAAALAADPGLGRQTGRLEVDAMEYPWSAIGRLNIGGRGHCTGFLVGARSVVTAAHCLYDSRDRRWHDVRDLHFIAGYQRDTTLIHSPVAAYARAAAYDPDTASSIATALHDWAVLTLTEPIGTQAGWLGLRETDARILNRARHGEAQFLQAGYRQGWTHILSVSLACEIKGFFGEKRGIVHGCDLAKGDSGSPLMILADGRLSVTGLHVLDLTTGSGRLAGALSIALFRSGSGEAQAAAALRGAGVTWGPGRAPGPGSLATSGPVGTVESLLGELGLLEPGRREGAGARRRAAIETFQARTGLPVTGETSLALLGHLIAARD